MSRWAERFAFARNALGSYGQQALLGVTALALTPYLFRKLGTDGFGTWSVMFTLTTIFLMLEVGFSTGVTKFVAQFRAEERRADLQRTVGASVLLMAGLGLAALAVSVALAVFVPGLAADSEVGAFRTGMFVLGGAMLLRLPFVAYGAALIGYQRYDRYAIGQSVLTVVFGVGAVVAVEAGGGVLGVAVAYAVGLIVGGLAFAPLLRRTDSELSLRPRLAGPEERRRVAGFGGFSLLADAMIFVGSRMDTVVIAAIRNAAAAAPFAAAVKLQSALGALTLPFLNLLMPMISELDARGLRDAVLRRFELATRVTAQMTLPVAVGVALFASDIVSTWLGPTAPPVTAAIMAILALQTLMLSAVAADKVLIGIGRVRLVGGLNLLEGLSNLAISIALVSAYGAIGAAVGTLVASTVLGPLKFPLACRAIDRSTLAFLRSSIGPAVASSIPGLAAMVAVWAAMEPGAARLAIGLPLGIVISLAVATYQVGPRRLAGELRGLSRRREGPAEVAESQVAVPSLP